MPDSDLTPMWHAELASLRRFVDKKRNLVQGMIVAYGTSTSPALIPMAFGPPGVLAMGLGAALASLIVGEADVVGLSSALGSLPAIGGESHRGYMHLDRTTALIKMIDDLQASTPRGVEVFFAFTKGDHAPSTGLGGTPEALVRVLLFSCARLLGESPESRQLLVTSFRVAARRGDQPQQGARWN